MKKALITGITGQDGSYLADFLLKKGYQVHGIIRRSSTFNTSRIDHLYQDPHTNGVRMFLHYGDLSDASNITRLLEKIKPDEIYHLGAQSHVRVSFDLPEYTCDVTGLGTLRILDAIKEAGIKPKFYQASSSEMYGNALESPQNENTPLNPCSPYACAKVFAFHITKNYRESYKLFACNGILFNHESPRRGETFDTRKVTRAVARIALGLQGRLYLGNLAARRDWGHARDYVAAQWLMLQRDTPRDYVIATGEQHSVREFVEQAFAAAGITLAWRGSGIDETGVVAGVSGCDDAAPACRPGDTVVCIDPAYFRPTEVESLLGDASRARQELGWQPRIGFAELVREMVDADLQQARLEQLAGERGFATYQRYE